MRVISQNVAPCGHRNPHGLTVVHGKRWECPRCVALKLFDLNQKLICEHARGEYDKGNFPEARALCEVALACGPCPSTVACTAFDEGRRAGE